MPKLTLISKDEVTYLTKGKAYITKNYTQAECDNIKDQIQHSTHATIHVIADDGMDHAYFASRFELITTPIIITHVDPFNLDLT